MEPKRRQAIALVALLAALVGVLAFQWQRLPAQGTAAGESLPARASAGAGGRGGDTSEPLGLRLADLARTRPGPDASERNPFQFDAGRAGTPRTAVAQPGGVQMPPTAPAPPPGPPPIPLKFIGLVDAPGQTARLAVLSDGRNVFHGREGDIIDGRYRIVRIGLESIEMTYLDGRGRQVIRLSGAG